MKHPCLSTKLERHSTKPTKQDRPERAELLPEKVRSSWVDCCLYLSQLIIVFLAEAEPDNDKDEESYYSANNDDDKKEAIDNDKEEEEKEKGEPIDEEELEGFE
jgi:hypothetical protein